MADQRQCRWPVLCRARTIKQAKIAAEPACRNLAHQLLRNLKVVPVLLPIAVHRFAPRLPQRENVVVASAPLSDVDGVAIVSIHPQPLALYRPASHDLMRASTLGEDSGRQKV